MTKPVKLETLFLDGGRVSLAFLYSLTDPSQYEELKCQYCGHDEFFHVISMPNALNKIIAHCNECSMVNEWRLD